MHCVTKKFFKIKNKDIRIEKDNLSLFSCFFYSLKIYEVFFKCIRFLSFRVLKIQNIKIIQNISFYFFNFVILIIIVF